MPLFAFANAGLSLSGLSWHVIFEPVALGIIAGLFLGKQIGVLLSVWLATRLKLATLPEKATWLQLYGVAILCGIGFTMSLFLGALAFQNQELYATEVRVGVLVGSILSGLAGAIILSLAKPQNQKNL